MPATIKINPERTELVCELDGEVICHKEGFAPGDLDGGIIVMDDTHIFVIADEDIEDGQLYSLIPLDTTVEESADLSEYEDDDEDDEESDDDEDEDVE